MTQEEYTDLMGYETLASEDEYEKADFIYSMTSPHTTKQDFCEAYRKAKGNPLLHDLAEQASIEATNRRTLKVQQGEEARNILKVADEIRKAGMEEAAESLDGIARRLIGKAETVIFKIEHGLALSDRDHAYIKRTLAALH